MGALAYTLNDYNVGDRCLYFGEKVIVLEIPRWWNFYRRHVQLAKAKVLHENGEERWAYISELIPVDKMTKGQAAFRRVWGTE